MAEINYFVAQQVERSFPKFDHQDKEVSFSFHHVELDAPFHFICTVEQAPWKQSTSPRLTFPRSLTWNNPSSFKFSLKLKCHATPSTGHVPRCWSRILTRPVSIFISSKRWLPYFRGDNEESTIDWENIFNPWWIKIYDIAFLRLF